MLKGYFHESSGDGNRLIMKSKELVKDLKSAEAIYGLIKSLARLGLADWNTHLKFSALVLKAHALDVAARNDKLLGR